VSVRVLVADDQALVRAGFRKILEADPDIEVVGEAGDGLEAVERVRRLAPDVVLMDIRMPGLDGIAATRELAQTPSAGPRVLVLTTFGLEEYVYEALRAGASGFLLKDVPPEHLLAAVHVVAHGDALLDPAITRTVIQELAGKPAVRREFGAKLEELTARGREVFALVARGLSNAEIAAKLVVSEGTVKTHVAHVLLKLGLRDRVQAVIYAYESGAVQPGARSTGRRSPLGRGDRLCRGRHARSASTEGVARPLPARRYFGAGSGEPRAFRAIRTTTRLARSTTR
jgi:DNA-binding NarL/FixJ family response regulator